MPSLMETIARDMIVPASLIEEGIRDAYHHVKLIKIPKRSGGMRSVYQPSSKLKLIQYWLIDHCLSKIDIHESAAAFFEGASIRSNAQKHSANKYFVRVDLENFFPSIRFEDFIPHLEKWHKNACPDWPLNADSLKIIESTLFDKSKRLPIGFPTSPVVANIVMTSVDELIVERIAQNKDLGSITYTRYADDIILSGNTKGISGKLVATVRHILNEIDTPKLKINEKKTNFTSRLGGSALVTGIRIRQDASITLTRAYKDRIRLMLSRLKNGASLKETPKQISGHLNHIRDIDPDYFNWISNHYFDVIEKLSLLEKGGPHTPL